MSITEGGPLDAWLRRTQLAYQQLLSLDAPGGFSFENFSRRSIQFFEALLLEQTPAGGSTLNQKPAAWVDARTAYVGEALLRLAGGKWIWDVEADRPVLNLALPDLDAYACPSELLATAANVRTGTVLLTAHDAVVAAAKARRRADPQWSPARTATPVLYDPEDTTTWDQYIRDWIAARERAFTAWQAAADPEVGWDFSIESLDELERVLRRAIRREKDFDATINTALLDGASWYYGEVVRRLHAARWEYRPDEQRFDIFAGEIYLISTGKRLGLAFPFTILRQLAPWQPGRRGYLRRRAKSFN